MRPPPDAAAAEQAAWVRFVEQLADDLAVQWPAMPERLGDRYRAFVEGTVQQALQRGLEGAPAVARYVNLCFVMGQLLGNGVTAGTSQLEDHWAYSIPFALQWFWIIIIIPGMFFVPESPWWLVRQGRFEDARNVLGRLAGDKVNIDSTLSVIIETDRLEQELEAGSTYADCFKGVNLRRTEIATGVYCTQVLSGIYLINYGTYFFQQAGLPTNRAFQMGIGFLGKCPTPTVSSLDSLSGIHHFTAPPY